MARQQVTQVQLSRSIGMSQQSLSERLRGKTPFTTDDLEAVAGALGVHPATLLGGRGDLPEPPPVTTARYSREPVTLGDFPTIGRLQPAQTVQVAA
jgi:transcriptional regulator with XRE-family HTH domain